VTARISFHGVTKTFDATVALQDVSFDVQAGQVHALLGANGAGKSTLIKILSGLYTQEEGSILVDGSAGKQAISFIHQDLGLVDTMSVAESIALTRGFPRRAGLIDWREVRRVAKDALAVVGARIPVDAIISGLSRADRSIVAIARAITEDCTVLVLDEPTASLPDADVQRLFVILKALRDRGVSILYVTHRLDEVFQIGDQMTVLRDGHVVACASVAETTHEQLVRLIVGGEPPQRHRTTTESGSRDIIRLCGVALADDRPPVDEVRLRVGEILGLVGLRGGGQELLGRGLAGVESVEIESVEIDGVSVPRRHAARRLKHAIGFVSSRREQEGLAMTLTVRENLFMNPAAAGRRLVSWIGRRRERDNASRVGESLQLRPNRSEAVAGTLSGGNQQKVVLGRWLSTNVRALVLEEPTMGIDVGARAEIYRLIRGAAGDGLSVVVVSSDYEELALLCHRALVLDRGSVVRELEGRDVNVDNITHYATGGG
jgi:ribose transport system ATP-binding protein